MTPPTRLRPRARLCTGCRDLPVGRQPGQSLVEFAIIGPLFFALVLITIEAGLLMNAQITLDNATREAARTAALCGNTKGTWSTFTGSPSGGSTCAQALWSTFKTDQGILNFIGGAATSPNFTVTTPTDSADSACGASGTQYDGAPQGCPIVLATTYQYSFLLGFVLGPAAPTITLSSQAHVVSQQ